MIGIIYYVLGLTMNITTMVYIINRCHGCECGIYPQLIIIDIFIGNKYFYVGGGKWKDL